MWKERANIPIYGENDDRGASTPAEHDRDGTRANGHGASGTRSNAVAGPSRRRGPRTTRAQSQTQVQPPTPMQPQDPSTSATVSQPQHQELFTHTALTNATTPATQQYGYMPMTPQYPAPPPNYSQPHTYPGSYMYPSVSTSVSQSGAMTPQQSPAAPSRLAQAIQALQSTDSLDERTLARIVRVFAFRPDCADAYLALTGDNTRALFVRELLKEEHLGSSDHSDI